MFIKQKDICSLMQYTNDLTPDVLAEMAFSPFTEKDLTTMTEEMRMLIDEQAVYARNHPVTAIYRLAVAGSLTRLGGVADEFSTNPDDGFKIIRADGELVSVLTEGSTVTYPDGNTARVVSTAGHQFAVGGTTTAIVGSMLDNGDEIISTPQKSAYLVRREGVPLPDDFLVIPGA